MKITENVMDNVSQIDLEGRFDANTCDMVEQFIRERIEDGKYNLVLNMEKVPFTASAGLRVILVIAKELRKEYNGDLRIASPQSNVSKVFEISGMNNVLRIFDNPGAAIKSFTE